jgi:hypothetical protein
LLQRPGGPVVLAGPLRARDNPLREPDLPLMRVRQRSSVPPG